MNQFNLRKKKEKNFSSTYSFTCCKIINGNDPIKFKARKNEKKKLITCITLLVQKIPKSKDAFPFVESTTYPLNFVEIINKGLNREMRM